MAHSMVYKNLQVVAEISHLFLVLADQERSTPIGCGLEEKPEE